METTLKLLKKYGHFLGIILFSYIIYKIDIKKLLSILADSDLRYITLTLLLSLLIVPLMVVRWRVILKAMGIKYGFINSSVSLIKAAMLGEVTPGKLGEFLRAKYLINKSDTTLGKAFFSVVADRIYDIVILIILALLSIFFMTTTYAVKISFVYVAGAFAGIVLFLTFIMNERLVRSIFSPVFNMLVPEKHQESARFHFVEFYDGLKLMKISTHTTCGALSTIIWAMKLFMLFLLTLSIGIKVPFWFIIAIGSINVVVSLIPISVSGFGTREAVFIFFLSFHHISAEFAVALSFLSLVFAVLGMALLGGVVYIREMATSISTD